MGTMTEAAPMAIADLPVSAISDKEGKIFRRQK